MLKKFITVAACSLIIVGCSTDYKRGQGGGPVTGSSNVAGGAAGAHPELEKCSQPLGSAALVENTNHVVNYSQYGIQSPTILVRLMMQQSGCFVVVDRGAAMNNMMFERNLNNSGELRSDASMGKGQMVSADFSITPNITFVENNAGSKSVGLAVGSAIPYVGGIIGAVGAAYELKFKEAETALIMVDNRTGVQVAMAQGSTSKADANYVLGIFASYTNTNEAKVVASAYLDAFNQLVKAGKAAGYKYEPQEASALKPQKKKKK